MQKLGTNIVQSDLGISPNPIFQMTTGYWVSKTLMSAVELEVFTKLPGGRRGGFFSRVPGRGRISNPFIIIIPAVIGIMIVAIVITGSIKIVDAGYRGVLLSFGTVDTASSP